MSYEINPHQQPHRLSSHRPIAVSDLLSCYFVFFDICLVSQFVYYYTPRQVKSIAILTSPSALRAVHLLSNTRQKRIHLIKHAVLDRLVRPTRSTLVHDLQWTT